MGASWSWLVSAELRFNERLQKLLGGQVGDSLGDCPEAATAPRSRVGRWSLGDLSMLNYAWVSAKPSGSVGS